LALRAAAFAAECVLVFALAAPALAESFDSAQADVDQRLSRALDELRSVRDEIAREKIPLSKSVSDLEDAVVTLRRKRAELLETRDSRGIDLTSLQNQVASLAEQNEFVASRLNEFEREFESRLDISELPRYEALITAAKLADKDVNLDSVERRERQVAVVDAALARLQAQLGGEIYPGEALSPQGLLTEGKFIALGPVVLYASNDGSVTGLVENQLNAADPVVVELPGGFSDGIVQIASSGRGELPFDATLGKAIMIENARKTLMQYVDEGGYVGYVIIALGLSALLLTVFKGVEILGFQVAETSEVDGILSELARGSLAAAARKAELVKGVAGEMLKTGVLHVEETRSVLEELLFEKILRVRPTLERFLPFLAITAAAAPLLGLLGTVTGMIKTFQLITVFGTGDAKSLSSGISEALVTTALGLIVAIPTLILHGALSRMAKRKLGMLEELSVAFVNGISAVRLPRKQLAPTREDLDE
jgi:biopolymer transport protein ExbB